MRIISLLLALIFLIPTHGWTVVKRGETRADVDRSLNVEITQYRRLQNLVYKNCMQNPNANAFRAEVGGKTLNCADLFQVSNSYKKKIEAQVDKLEDECEFSNDAGLQAHATEALKIAQAAGLCKKVSSDLQCAGIAACAISTVAMPLISILAQATGDKNKCAETGSNCMQSIFKGIVTDIWGTLTSLWEGVKYVGRAAGEWLGIISRHEQSSSEKAMAAQQANPGFIAQFRANPAKAISDLGKKIFNAMKIAAMETYGCEEWTVPPNRKVSGMAGMVMKGAVCTRPMTNWDCATCNQKIQVFCGIGGMAVGEIIAGLLTGGLAAGAKFVAGGVKAAVLATARGQRIAAAGARSLEGAKVVLSAIPKSAEGLAGASRTALRSAGAARVLSAAEKASIASWNSLKALPLSSEIGRGARAAGRELAYQGTLAARDLKVLSTPLTAYLGAIEEATKLGFNTVDSTLARATSNATRATEVAEVAAVGNRAGNGTSAVESPRLVVASDSPVITPELRRAASFTTEQRVTEAQTLVGRDLTATQAQALQNAHEVGAGSGRGYFTYTKEEIAKKGLILREAGFSAPEIRTLVQSGVAGSLPTATLAERAATYVRGAKVEFQEGRNALIDSKDTLSKISNAAGRTDVNTDELMGLYRAQNRSASDGFFNEGIRTQSPQYVAESWRLSTKAGDIQDAVQTMRRGVSEFKMVPEKIIDGVDMEIRRLNLLLTSPGQKGNAAFEAELKSYKELKVAAQKEFGLVQPLVRPPVLTPPVRTAPALQVAETKPAAVVAAPVTPVTPTPAPIVSAPVVSAPEVVSAPTVFRAPSGTPRRDIIDRAGDYRLGNNGKPKDPAKAAALFYQADEEVIKNEVIRSIRAGDNETRFFDNTKLHDAFTSSMQADGAIARQMIDEAFKNGGEKYASHYVNMMINEIEERGLARFSKAPEVRANVVEFAKYVQEKYKKGFYTQDQTVKRWITSNDY